MSLRSIVVGSVLCAVAAGCGGGVELVREDQMGPTGETSDAVRACASGPTVQGLDVSGYQGSINWGAVAASGKKFAIMKATEGTGYTDSTFARNWAGAKAAGVIRGAYHFFHPAIDPIAQADHFVNVMGALGPGDLPPMLDLEVTNGLGGAAITNSVRRFLQHVEARSGKRPLIYTGYYFWRDNVGDPAGFNQYPLVMAAYVAGCPLVPNSWGHFTMWQYTDAGRVSGIGGGVDLDVFNGDLNQLHALAGGHAGPPPPAPTGCGILGRGHVVEKGVTETSCDGRFRLVHQLDGNVVLYDDVSHRALWSTGTNGRDTSSFVMQTDGNLVLYAPGGHALWASGTWGNDGAYGVVQDDGNLVVYDAYGKALWASRTVVAACGNEIHENTTLAKDQGVFSCGRRYFFVHQGDGNVVLYGPGGHALWATGTNGRTTDAFVMQGDGNLVLYAPGGHPVWASGTDRHPGSYLAVQDDGNVVIYSGQGHALWATNTVE